MKICSLYIISGLAATVPAFAQQSAPIVDSRSGQAPLMERQKEIALALSACPGYVAPKATVYVLGKSGYEKAREGENGFVAIVGHAFPTSAEPQCMNSEATRSQLPPILKLAELRAQGKSAEEIRRFTTESRSNGTFPKPESGVVYMLSTENRPPSFTGKVAAFPPHVMFLSPGARNADLGADVRLGPSGNPTSPVFVVNEGTPEAIIIVVAGTNPEAAAHVHTADPR
jgi:hypothetical protein